MNGKSSHILTTSSNLIGFTFLVFSSIKSLGLPETKLIDKVLALCVMIFALSSFLSFLSIRAADDEGKSARYELIADAVFFLGLFIVVIISVLLAFDFIVLPIRH